MSVVAALALGVPVLAVSPSTVAAAAEPSVRVSITATRASSDEVTLSGAVTNTGAEPLLDVTANLWRSTAVLRSADAVRTALAADATTPGRAPATEASHSTRVVAGTAPLAPGETRTFTVWGSARLLGLTDPAASYWVGVDVRGRAQRQRAVSDLAQDRSLITRSPEPIPLATVVELSSRPRQVKTNLFTDDDLAAELSGGRLDTLLRAAQERDADWLLDPGLLAEVRDMADGYRIQTESGSTEGPSSAAASAWLERLAALPPARGRLGLFGSPDLSTLAALGDRTIVERAERASSASTLEGAAQAALLPQPDAAALTLLADSRRPVVALTTAPHSVHADAGGVSILAAQRPTDRLITSRVLPDTATNRAAASRALARALGGQVRLLRSPEDVAALGNSVDGYQPVGLATLLEAAPTAWTPPPRVAEAPLTLDHPTLDEVIGLTDSIQRYADAAPRAGFTGMADAQAARSASVWWADAAAARDAWLGGLTRRLALPEGGEAVTLTASSRFAMTGATSDFPVTVTNHLADPVQVQVVVHTDNPQRIRFARPEDITVPPGASSTLTLHATAAGSGLVTATAYVQTLSGHRLTPDSEIAVETTNFGVIGWVLVVGSGIVLLVTTALRIRQVRARRRELDE